MTPQKHNLDFAALRVLKLVHDHRSFTGAATVLNINQSAVSYTIEKLRRVFDDPLFYREGGRVVATERCDALARQADEMLDQFEHMVAPQRFDPGAASDTVTIACNYYERQVLLPQVIQGLRQDAPGLRLRLVNATHQGPDLLKRGAADMLIGPLVPEAGAFFCQTLLEDRYACVMNPRHPLAVGALDADSYLAARHIVVTYGQDWRSRYLQDIDAKGLELRPALELPSPAGLDQFLLGSDLIATIPERLAQRFGPGLTMRACPFPAPFAISLVWTTRTHHAGLHEWLRKRIFDQVKQHVGRALPDRSAPDRHQADMD